MSSKKIRKRERLVVKVVLALGIAILILNAGQGWLVKGSTEKEVNPKSTGKKVSQKSTEKVAVKKNQRDIPAG